MHVIIWEYQVKAGHAGEFEEIYAPQGAWTRLFQKHPGYRSTELLQDAEHSNHYITIDRWVSAEAYNSFRLKWQAEYKELDARCEHLTEHESCLGTFHLHHPEER